MLKTQKLLIGVCSLALLLIAGPAQAQEGEPPAAEGAASEARVYPDQDDIVRVLTSIDTLQTAMSAFSMVGLVETLQDEGPYTVFVPTTEAFRELTARMNGNLLFPNSQDDKELLAAILRYHIVPGTVDARNIAQTPYLPTLQGDTLRTSQDGTIVSGLNEATVVVETIPAENGLIHIVDTVLLPPMEETERTENYSPNRQ